MLKHKSDTVRKCESQKTQHEKSVSFADTSFCATSYCERTCHSTMLETPSLVACAPLYTACFENDIFVVKHILSYYQKESMLSLIHLIRQGGPSPLQIACRFGYSQLAQMLLSHGADPNDHISTNRSESCFQLCVMRQDIALIKLLIANDYRILDADVAAAITTGNLHLTKEIILAIRSSCDSDRDALDKNRFRRLYRTACMVTQHRKCSKLLWFIIKCNEDHHSRQICLYCVRKAVKNANYLLLYALAKRLCGRTYVWQYRHQRIGKSLLHDAVIHGNARIMLILLRMDVDVNATDVQGINPLYIACARGHWEAAKLLLENGAVAFTPVGPNAETPLHISAQENHLDCVKLLLQQNAVDVDARTHHRCTALHLACQRGNTAVADYLLQHGANPQALTALNETSLVKADRMCHTSTVMLLQKHCQYSMHTNGNAVAVGDIALPSTTLPLRQSFGQCIGNWMQYFTYKKQYVKCRNTKVHIKE